jgi:hypothetical protein
MWTLVDQMGRSNLCGFFIGRFLLGGAFERDFLFLLGAWSPCTQVPQQGLRPGERGLAHLAESSTMTRHARTAKSARSLARSSPLSLPWMGHFVVFAPVRSASARLPSRMARDSSGSGSGLPRTHNGEDEAGAVSPPPRYMFGLHRTSFPLHPTHAHGYSLTCRPTRCSSKARSSCGPSSCGPSSCGPSSCGPSS